MPTLKLEATFQLDSFPNRRGLNLLTAPNHIWYGLRFDGTGITSAAG